MSELDGIEVVAVVPRDATAADRGRMSDAILLAWFNSGARSAQPTIDRLRAELAELQEKAKSAMSERDKLLAHIKALEHAAAVTGAFQAPGVVETQGNYILDSLAHFR